MGTAPIGIHRHLARCNIADPCIGCVVIRDPQFRAVRRECQDSGHAPDRQSCDNLVFSEINVEDLIRHSIVEVHMRAIGSDGDSRGALSGRNRNGLRRGEELDALTKPQASYKKTGYRVTGSADLLRATQ